MDWELFLQEKGAVLLVVGGMVAAMLLIFILRKLGDVRSQKPKVILSQVRWQLRSVRDEFSQYPGTREVHEIVNGLDAAQQTIDEVMGKL